MVAVTVNGGATICCVKPTNNTGSLPTGDRAFSAVQLDFKQEHSHFAWRIGFALVDRQLAPVRSHPGCPPPFSSTCAIPCRESVGSLGVTVSCRNMLSRRHLRNQRLLIEPCLSTAEQKFLGPVVEVSLQHNRGMEGAHLDSLWAMMDPHMDIKICTPFE